VFKEAPYFSVNVLSANQSHIADSFAKHTSRKNEMLKVYRHERTGCLLLSDALGHVVCERGAIYEGGDHHIILGTVIAVGAHSHALPLVRQKGQYLTTQSLSIEPLQQVCAL
jgi:flavin reductase (DIM6/NTAB) family NADH-FMN oxidoreductase RutF